MTKQELITKMMNGRKWSHKYLSRAEWTEIKV
jgi:hypothetical protein